MEKTTLEHQIAQLRPLLLRTERQYFGTTDDAEDAVQEDCLRLWKVSHRLAETDPVKPLALRIVKNCCYDIRHSADRLTEALTDELEAPTLETPHTHLEQMDLLRLVDVAIGHLPGSEGRVFRMSRDAGMSIGQIALATGCTEGSVTTMLSNARRHLKKVLKKLT